LPSKSSTHPSSQAAELEQGSATTDEIDGRVPVTVDDGGKGATARVWYRVFVSPSSEKYVLVLIWIVDLAKGA
jgi:hypothetical protein